MGVGWAIEVCGLRTMYSDLSGAGDLDEFVDGLWGLGKGNLSFANVDNGLESGEEIHTQNTIDVAGNGNLERKNRKVFEALAEAIEPGDWHDRSINGAVTREDGSPGRLAINGTTDILEEFNRQTGLGSTSVD
jgi:hypothetical protein